MGSKPLLIDSKLLSSAAAAAADSPRRRKNLNFHTPEHEGANRLLNAVEPGSYVQPHRHLDADKDETLVVVRGSFGLVFFDEAGNVTQTAVAKAAGDVVGVNIPHGTYHSLVAMEPGSVFFEAKAGPYVPITDAERAPWAPREGEPGVAEYLCRLEALFV
jgi:cupin fold WbuC family metalloprotein